MSIFTETFISYGVKSANKIQKFKQNQMIPLYKNFDFYNSTV